MKRQKKQVIKAQKKQVMKPSFSLTESEKESKDFTLVGFFPKISLSKIGYSIWFVYIDYTST